MGLEHKPSVKDYWSSVLCYSNLFFSNMFKRDRLETIYHTMLHASDVNSVSKERIEQFTKRLVSRYQEAYYPGQNMVIDEMVIGWKGRWRYKQYNATKPQVPHQDFWTM